ncbi:hypothetical protein GWO43_16105 [candidate division KSB1 bacterium]|nr:hypothetical protein [candidate division KSB1 bacterium]NIV68757.1 hypothetical protein [Phycisphaerae bacterium]NIS25474.1 hypothetical protein [candidate division KSB1 bacterium]NIT72367.1 hypothetical protein [candidate division KSB1 bacterium]NIU26151.1 hypothetical protein [candidate division KSB1 bacterium]
MEKEKSDVGVRWGKIDKWIDSMNAGRFGGGWERAEKVFSGQELEIAKRIERAYWIGDEKGGNNAMVDY